MLPLATKDTRLSEVQMLPTCLYNPNLKKKKEKNLDKTRAGPMPMISDIKVFGVYFLMEEVGVGQVVRDI